MFPRLDDGPPDRLYILQTSSDPLIESYARGGGAPASGRSSFRPDRDVLQDHAGSRMAPSRQRTTKDGVSPTEGANTHSPRCQHTLVIPQ